MRQCLTLGGFAGLAFHLAPALLPASSSSWHSMCDGARPGEGGVAPPSCCVQHWWPAPHGPGGTHVALGDVFFVRSNFGLELRIGNHDGARADVWSQAPGRRNPGVNPDEARACGTWVRRRTCARCATPR